MKYSKYFLIIAFFGIVTSCSDFLDRTNPNEPDNVTFWVNEDQLKNALPPCYEALQKDYLVNWTAETPNLYTLVISLKHTNGDIIEATGCKVGFRTVEIKDKQLMVNGRPILVKGVNYHEHNEYTGHYVPEELMLKDFELWKRYISTSVSTS